MTANPASRHPGIRMLLILPAVLSMASCHEDQPPAPGKSPDPVSTPAPSSTAVPNQNPPPVEQGLTLEIAIEDGGMLAFVFRNQSNQPIRLLKKFEPLPVFFSLDIKTDDGQVVDVPGAGKISFGPGSLAYEAVPAGGSFKHSIHLARTLETLRVQPPMKPFTISATYHNQYGEDCVQGMFPSKAIHVSKLQSP